MGKISVNKKCDVKSFVNFISSQQGPGVSVVLLAGDGSLGLAEGSGPLPLQLSGLLGLLLSLGQDLEMKYISFGFSVGAMWSKDEIRNHENYLVILNPDTGY